uniref:Uncharacterized protein n=1 Tax=Seriola lalandi dorsalis TaxID=1841481 RepID=A0A3B4X9I2_SERLL
SDLSLTHKSAGYYEFLHHQQLFLKKKKKKNQRRVDVSITIKKWDKGGDVAVMDTVCELHSLLSFYFQNHWLNENKIEFIENSTRSIFRNCVLKTSHQDCDVITKQSPLSDVPTSGPTVQLCRIWFLSFCLKFLVLSIMLFYELHLD